MRMILKNVSYLAVLTALSACGAQRTDSTSGLAEDQRADLRAGRFDAPDLLDAIAKAPQNSKLPAQGVTDQQVDAAFGNLNGKLQVDRATGRLRLDDTFDRSLTPSQKAGLAALQKGLEVRVREGAVKLARSPSGHTTIVPADGKLGDQGDGVVAGPRGNPPIDTLELTESASGPGFTPEHRIGDGRWSWRLSYKWWGVSLSLNHNFLNYLCNNTEWMLGRAGLPGWIKVVIRPLGCLLHSLDSGANGSSISITWTGVFWYTP